MNMDGRRAVAVNDVQAIVTEAGRDGVEVSRWLAVEARKRRRGRQQDRAGIGFRRPEYRGVGRCEIGAHRRSEEHTSELQSLMRISSAVFCLKKKNTKGVRHDRNQLAKENIQ